MKYSEMVAIPKEEWLSIIQACASKGIPVSNLIDKTKPLLPLVENAFDAGSEWSVEGGNRLYNSKQRFIEKGIQ